MSISSPLTPKLSKPKFDHSSSKHEKSKSHIKFTMKEIYQEEDKNSKIIKYLLNDLSSPKQLSPLKHFNSDKKEKKRISQNYDSTPSLDIEPPIILNIYQEGMELQRPELKKMWGSPKRDETSDFMMMLRKTKTELLNVMSENADLVARMKEKDEKNKANINEEGKKSKKKSKEITIKKRFVKFLNPELNEPISPLKTESNISNWERRAENSSDKQMTARSLSKTELKNPYNLDLKGPKGLDKLSFLEKIKQKYSFKTKKEQFLSTTPTLSPTTTFKKDGYLSRGDREGKELEYVMKANRYHKFPTFEKKDNSKEKFDKFYNNLIGYYEEECRNKDQFELGISKQIRLYDERLRDFNKQLLDPSERIDLELDKDVFNLEAKTFAFRNYRFKKRK